MPVGGRSVRRALAVVTVIAVTMVGCSGGGSKARGPTRPGAGPTAHVSHHGAILEIATSETIDESGRPGPVRWQFPQSTAQIAAAIRIGRLPAPATLVVRWHSSNESRAPLFEHRIRVTSGSRAWSVGSSPGRLARGSYLIEARLGRDRAATAVTVVRTPVDASRLRAGPGRAVRAAEDPVTGAPRPGESGSAPPPPGSATGGCTLSITPDVGLYATYDVSGCSSRDRIGVGASVPGGRATEYRRFLGNGAGALQVDPCAIGGSDLPGSELLYTMQVTEGPNTGRSTEQRVRVPEDKAGPRLSALSEPPDGVLVAAGDTIELVTQAEEPLFETGVARLQVEADGRTLLDRRYGSEPRSCDRGRLLQVRTVRYVVPDDPPPLVTVTVKSADFAGNTSELVYQYPTSAMVSGSVSADTSELANGNMCRARWEAEFYLVVDRGGEVVGHGQAVPVDPPSCSVGKPPQPGPVSLTITGAASGRRFRLRFQAEEVSGFDAGFHLLWYPGPPTVSARLGDWTHFELSNDGPEECAGGGCSARLEGVVDLTCQDCKEGDGW